MDPRTTARRLYFTGPGTVEIVERPRPAPGEGEVLVESRLSAISPGTEGLIYRGEAPTELEADEGIDALEGDLSFPLSYGYAVVGRVIEVGDGVDDGWLDRRVFAYNPHESHFLASPEELLVVPEEVSTERATLFANVETAVSFLLDGRPAIGERVAVFGQGVVGLLTTALLAGTQIDRLLAVDRIGPRRRLAGELGADLTVDPDEEAPASVLERTAGDRADLAYELSGNPDALDDAIAATGFGGRVVVGSWYGTKPATVSLGGRFHRDRIELRSSQVSTIAPEHEGRWSRSRRREVAWRRLAELPVDGLVSHELPLEEAPAAYRLIEERPEEAVCVLFRYD